MGWLSLCWDGVLAVGVVSKSGCRGGLLTGSWLIVAGIVRVSLVPLRVSCACVPCVCHCGGSAGARFLVLVACLLDGVGMVLRFTGAVAVGLRCCGAVVGRGRSADLLQ
eukprot:6583767-Pyramimonas_sp.AAC.1